MPTDVRTFAARPNRTAYFGIRSPIRVQVAGRIRQAVLTARAPRALRATLLRPEYADYREREYALAAACRRLRGRTSSVDAGGDTRQLTFEPPHHLCAAHDVVRFSVAMRSRLLDLGP